MHLPAVVAVAYRPRHDDRIYELLCANLCCHADHALKVFVASGPPRGMVPKKHSICSMHLDAIIVSPLTPRGLVRPTPAPMSSAARRNRHQTYPEPARPATPPRRCRHRTALSRCTGPRLSPAAITVGSACFCRTKLAAQIDAAMSGTL